MNVTGGRRPFGLSDQCWAPVRIQLLWQGPPAYSSILTGFRSIFQIALVIFNLPKRMKPPDLVTVVPVTRAVKTSCSKTMDFGDPEIKKTAARIKKKHVVRSEICVFFARNSIYTIFLGSITVFLMKDSLMSFFLKVQTFFFEPGITWLVVFERQTIFS